ncbi:hypothetical protein L3Q72_22495 [Vibrio sp. JC009]|uniref:hypothetical protein n=1 Tax=Vibrio sp. JC009 TaxID=2912314 RepID=UPI0023AFA6E1|nr:hypothetical protein [Vibrio sp. JC009]WED24003.1 hypothetical protein L3Q72_22495 [Vibrio sp. JC009]
MCSDDDAIKIHKCKVKLADLSSSIQIYQEEGEEWQLSLSRCATMEDLENNHYLECEGDIIEQTVISIVYCPYCGEKLSDSTPEVSFRQHDFSRW